MKAIGLLIFALLIPGPQKPDGIGVITTVVGGGHPRFRTGDVALESILEGASDVAVDAKGNKYIAGFLANRVFKIDPAGIVTVAAGSGEALTSGDGGPAIDAGINGPSALAVDGETLYIAEQLGDRIRQVDAKGIITTIAGTGERGNEKAYSAANKTPLNLPAGLFFRNGELYFTEFGGNRVRKIDHKGVLSTVAGTGEKRSSGDGCRATSASLNGPTGITMDAQGNLYVSEVFGARVRRIDKHGLIATIAGPGKTGQQSFSRKATNFNLRWPQGLAVDAADNLYIADFAESRIYRVDLPKGNISNFAGRGPGGFLQDRKATVPSAGDEIESPMGIRFDQSGNLLVAAYNQGSVLSIDKARNVKHLAGQFVPAIRTTTEDPDKTYLGNISGVATDARGNIYVAQVFGNSVLKVGPDNSLLSMVGTGSPRSAGDKGPAVKASLNHPVGVAASSQGLFVAEADGHRIRLIDQNGEIHTIAGTGEYGFSGDGGLAANARMAHPHGCFPSGDFIYPADRFASNVAKEKTNGAKVSQKSAHSSNVTNENLAAPVQRQKTGAFLAFVDTNNNRVRKIDEEGIITTIAGNGKAASTGDGGSATRAALNNPQDVVVDKSGNIYISEANRVRKVDTRGIISTYAGTGRRALTSFAGPATKVDLFAAYGLALDGQDLYIADPWNNIIWKVDSQGMMTLFAGNKERGSRGDGGLAIQASLNAPIYLAVQYKANATYLLVTELEGGRVRSIRLR